jgi:hypothetical protein
MMITIQWAVTTCRVRDQGDQSDYTASRYQKKSSYIGYSVTCRGMADSDVWSTATRFHSIRTLHTN